MFRRRLPLLGTTLCVALFLAACSTTGTHSGTTTTTATTAAVTSTVVSYVSPVDSHGQIAPGLSVASTLHGTCEPGSDVVSNAPVYRCFSGNEIYDPCWAESETVPTSVVCWLPTRQTVVMIVTTGLAASPYDATNLDYPWEVQLTTGQDCVALQGAHSQADGQAINYSCGTSTSGPQLLGTPDRSAALWSYQAVTSTGAGTYSAPRTVSVRTAWFAKP